LHFSVIVSDIHDTSRNPRIRNCSLFYYLENDSIKIVEHPQPNCSSGTLLRRSIVAKEDGSQLLLDDIQIGEDVVIYSQCYSVVGCTGSTRNFLEDIGRENLPPADSLEEGSVVTKEEPEWGAFRREKNNLKAFMEAKLGNTVNNTGREGFNEFGNMVLKFLCSWDNSEMLFGDMQEFVLVYHLADDTIEIFNSVGPGGAKEQFPKLLKRAPLVKDRDSTYGEDDDNQFYHWTDLFIGAEINVYSRLLRVIEADTETRNFYDMLEFPLAQGERSMSMSASQEKLVFERPIPPHNGFGSEEDSLKSCVGPLCPTSSSVRLNSFESRVLAFFARLVTDSCTDEARRFVISYYMQDNTIKIQEPPVRNSGFVGGLFLSRRKVKRSGGGGYMDQHDFQVGATVQVLTHKFIIEGANDFTLRWLESQSD
jgi:EF-hand domain-containing protein 1